MPRLSRSGCLQVNTCGWQTCVRGESVESAGYSTPWRWIYELGYRGIGSGGIDVIGIGAMPAT